VFGSTVVFFGMTVHATVRGSLKTKGVVGRLARVMARCCCVGPEKGKGGEGGEGRSGSLARVVPVQQEEQHRTTLKNEIAALKWQKNIRQTLMKNNKPPIHMYPDPNATQSNVANATSERDSKQP
jgi:hypothetical protein